MLLHATCISQPEWYFACVCPLFVYMYMYIHVHNSISTLNVQNTNPCVLLSVYIYSQLRPDLQHQSVFLRQLMQEANTLLQELQQ